MKKETLQSKLPGRAKNNNAKITTKPGKIAFGNKLITEKHKIAGMPTDISDALIKNSGIIIY